MEEAPENGKESPHSVHANGLIDIEIYNRGADKSLARPARKQADVSVRMA